MSRLANVLVVAAVLVQASMLTSGCASTASASGDSCEAEIAALQADVDSMAQLVQELSGRLEALEAEGPVTSIDGLAGGLVDGGIAIGPTGDPNEFEGGQLELLGTELYPWRFGLDRYQDQVRLMVRAEDEEWTVIALYSLETDKFILKRDLEVQGTIDSD